ncbi:MAG TPA: histidinol dehydrogenase [Woeseiaceae bacterium]|nr:histidinol dehydrogenase [Woeseiaceae bacterium]
MLEILDWSSLALAERRAALQRPAREDPARALETVREILQRVRREGDAALRALTLRFDGAAFGAVSAVELDEAEAALSPEQKQALDRAIANVKRFHAPQTPGSRRVQTSPGVVCEQRVLPIRAVGLYVPAGSAPLPSTAIMLAVPALLAGCPVRVLCTPPRKDGRADAAVLYVARRCGIGSVFKVGGAQAIAAMAFGTGSIPKVDKVFGPGNSFVIAAKQLVAGDPEGAAFDLPAGPSEVLIVADDSARADFVAADLLAQAEHSPEAQAVLIATSRALAERACSEVERQCAQLTRRDIVRQSLAAARVLAVETLDAALAVSNEYAPEHLILHVAEPRRWLEKVTSAGSVFLGPWSPETMGDYCSGANHVLPTYGYARAWSGLSLHDFTKRITVQELTAEGLRDLGPTACTMAGMEGLDAHANAVRVRLQAVRKLP